ncbi:MAG: hypothetical protein SGJ27_26285 [Candidatus Melainabacteria bacterium]|mgnify:CR=1 FL=1|nr:hypothetical protein [Candidatus Melainabacteria bacterium]
MLIDDQNLTKLREAGLHVSHPFAAFDHGVWVCKPAATPGNSIPEYKIGYITIGDGEQCPPLDAPMLKLMNSNSKWLVDGQDCVGGMGPADFINEWDDPDAAIKDILDFYFGDPTRMQRKAAERDKIRAKSALLDSPSP